MLQRIKFYKIITSYVHVETAIYVICYWKINQNLKILFIQFSKSITPINDGLEILTSVSIVILHLTIMLLDNYSGQLIINNSENIFYES